MIGVRYDLCSLIFCYCFRRNTNKNNLVYDEVFKKGLEKYVKIVNIKIIDKLLKKKTTNQS